MTHQTGIKPDENLSAVFSRANNDEIRAIQVSIVNEQLICSNTIYAKHGKIWNEEYDSIVENLVEENVPCFILYRYDEKSSLGYLWLLIDWIPDTSSIREKMLYASTKATLKYAFGSSYIKEHLIATSVEELTLAAYLKNKSQNLAPVPLTNREDELISCKAHTDICTDSRLKTFTGLSLSLTDSADKCLRDLTRNLYNYAQFKIDIKNETIDLVKTLNIQVNMLSHEIPQDAARYHICLFEHDYEGKFLTSILFIYSMPGYICSVKERMMYSSCKSSFIETIQSCGIQVSKMLEIDEGSVLTKEYLHEQLHPKIILNTPKFSKPKGPPNRGAKRVTKAQNHD